MTIKNNIGENIKKRRTKLGISQEDFAKKFDVKYRTLTKIESGVIKTPSVLMVEKIVKAVGVSVEELLKQHERFTGGGRNNFLSTRDRHSLGV